MFVFANADNGGTHYVHHARHRLNDGELLSRLMRCPDAGGTRHTVRSLAAATGVSKSKLSCMLRGHQMDVTAEQADAIAEAVDVRRAALFMPRSFVIANANETQGGGPR
jgi:transcriptional regulator with XRE-family HTH domain